MKSIRVPKGRRYPPRRPRNGHSPDCPYPKTDAQTCAVCASERIAPEPDLTEESA